MNKVVRITFPLDIWHANGAEVALWEISKILPLCWQFQRDDKRPNTVLIPHAHGRSEVLERYVREACMNNPLIMALVRGYALTFNWSDGTQTAVAMSPSAA